VRARHDADLCIIGAGSAGLTLAAGAAQLGARVVLVEGAEMGGDCLNRGCIPSKALLAAARSLPPGPQAHARAMERVRAAIAAIAPHDSQQRFEMLGVRVIRDWGRFVAPDRLRAGGQDIRARRFVIATGSQPVVPEIPGLSRLPWLTTDTLWSLDRLPAHLLILGAGPAGVEMAEAFARLGARVTLIEARTPLGREDPEAVAVLIAALGRLGVAIRAGAQVVAAEPGPDGVGIGLRLATGERIDGSHLLIAAGRAPALDRLDLAAAGVARTGAGIVTDDRLRSTNRRILAIGDAAGRGQYTHLAAWQAGVVLRAALFALPVRARDDHIPRAVHTDPGLAQIGLTEAEARARHGAALRVVRSDFAANDRAIAEGRTEGFLKLMILRNRAVGVTIAGAGAAESLAPWALMLGARLKLSLQMSAVLPYPTRSEVSSRALGTYFGPRVFGNIWIRRMVGSVQRFLP
jgi:pyruvate/2-oxoglutarate dehydrogenase complex dihydrolipoamide dehydrogenase (E3) component